MNFVFFQMSFSFNANSRMVGLAWSCMRLGDTYLGDRKLRDTFWPFRGCGWMGWLVGCVQVCGPRLPGFVLLGGFALGMVYDCCLWPVWRSWGVGC